ncbi:MAG: hypothetical protein ACKO3V_03265, partial [Pirellula sp.]
MAGKRFLRTTCCASLLWLAVCAPTRSEDPTRETILAWIADLSSGEFAVRDRATRQLNGLTADQLGLLVDQLAAADDPEVKVRLSGVVAKLKHERQQNIIRIFLRDPDMSQTHELEGWKTFSEVAGANRSSKRLFLELFDRYPELVEKPLESSQQAFDASAVVSRSIQDSMIQLGDGDEVDGLALLYCLCAMDARGDQRMASSALRILGRYPYNQMLRDPQAKRPMEVLVERWALSLQSSSDLTRAMLILVESELTSLRRVARKMLQDRQGPERADPEDVLIGLQMMFRFGQEEDLPVLEAWLDCTDVCVELTALGFPGGLQGGLPGGLPGGFMEQPGQPPQPRPEGNSLRTLEVRDAALLACMR